MPTYVFANMTWTGTVSSATTILTWGPNNGAMFTLSPDDQNNQKGNYLFPAGFTSIVNPYWLDLYLKGDMLLLFNSKKTFIKGIILLKVSTLSQNSTF